MDVLSIDLETFSSVDITSAGAYKYVESDDFEIMLLPSNQHVNEYVLTPEYHLQAKPKAIRLKIKPHITNN